MNYLDLDINLNEDDIALRQSAHRFAKEVMRPIAKELDEMTPEQVIAKDSPFWTFMKKAYELGYHKIYIPDTYGGLDLTPLQQAIIMEELAWGSVGLTVGLGVAGFFAFGGTLTGEDYLVDNFVTPFCECTDASIVGCWGITEPDHGSDTVMPGHPIFSDPNIKGQCRAKLDGDEYVINGQKAAWVSMGTVATHCFLFCQMDPSMGFAGSGIFTIPLDLPGVSKGAPLNKIGQRDLNQGEIFFDNVRVPKDCLIVGPEAYEVFLETTLSLTTASMGLYSIGIARAAMEEALEYAKNRIQGGKPLIEYPNVQMKLFEMFRKVETTRLMSRAAWNYNMNNTESAEEYSIIAKVHGTQSAYEVAHEAIQIFGGNGLSKEYLIEKLFRDARAMLIEDGSNDTLAISAGHKFIQTYPRMNDLT
ncbi:MAG: acyl-CoA/acyl-ACP dehydrogenase [Desulfobacteraceae bacterium]|nr:acyl-CoA/acyl-ACP dehydrogenase [Desulfobacteraceae bacterium]MBC2755886.1 acyl-CoA/acyl-ACP dehydrogenase [Desulfobacteraceae bacterium]